MVQVDRLPIRDGIAHVTDVWLSETAQGAVDDFARSVEGGRFVRKLYHWARAGFTHYEGGKGSPIKYEGKGVYRVGHKKWLFRLLGFYSNGKSEFVVIDAFWKSGQRLSASERNRVTEVARIKDDNLWRKGSS